METIDDLKKKFIQYVNEQSSAISEGNGKRANRFHKKIQDLHLKILNLYDNDVFKEFLDSEDDNIKLWASCFCKEIYPDITKKNLQGLINSSEPMISLSARYHLESLK